MRVGIDTTAIPPHRAGAGNYIFNLTAALAALPGDDEYVVFGSAATAQELQRRRAARRSDVQIEQVDLGSRGRRLLWEQSELPARARRLGLEVLHSPHYTMPIRKPCLRIVSIPDMTFFLLPEMHSFGKRLFFRRMIRWSVAAADHVIAISESSRTDLLRVLRVPPEKVRAVPLAADEHHKPLPLEEVAPVCGRYGLRPMEYILHVGVLEPRKNVPVLVDAHGTLPARYDSTPLVIVGKKGWMYSQIEERLKRAGRKVRVLGYVPDAELPALYNGARVVVYPSRYEGFGLPVLEAMQCGRPVITTDVSSMPEVAGDAALLVPPGNVDALSAALVRVLDDESFAGELGRRGRMRARLFTWERCARETREVYRAVAGAPSDYTRATARPGA